MTEPAYFEAQRSRYTLFLGVVLVGVTTSCGKSDSGPVDNGKVHIGDSKERVLTIMGNPQARDSKEGTEILYFQTGEVHIQDGNVVTIELDGSDIGRRGKWGESNP